MININNNIIEQSITLITNSLGLVVALAWNNAFQNLFKYNKILEKYGPWVYAIIVTIIIIILTKLNYKLKNKNN